MGYCDGKLGRRTKGSLACVPLRLVMNAPAQCQAQLICNVCCLQLACATGPHAFEKAKQGKQRLASQKDAMLVGPTLQLFGVFQAQMTLQRA